MSFDWVINALSSYKQLTSKRKIILLSMLVIISCFVARILYEAPDRASGKNPDDFAKYYVTSLRLHSGSKIYQPVLPSPEMTNISGKKYEGQPVRNADPPLMLLLSYPLAFFSYPVAWYLLLIFSSTCMVAVTVAVARQCKLKLYTGAMCLALSYCSFPNFVYLVLNRFECLIVVLSVLGWLALRRHNERLAGAYWGLAAALKLFPGLWVLMLLFSRYRRAGLWAIGTGCISSMFAIFVIGSSELNTFITKVLPQSLQFYNSQSNFSLVCLGTVFFNATVGWTLAVSVLLLIVVFLNRVTANADRLWIASASFSLLLSPLSWTCYFVLLPPTLILLTEYLRIERSLDRFLLGFLICSLLFWPSLLGGWLSPSLKPFFINSKIVAFIPTYGLLMLAGTALIRVKSHL